MLHARGTKIMNEALIIYVFLCASVNVTKYLLTSLHPNGVCMNLSF